MAKARSDMVVAGTPSMLEVPPPATVRMNPSVAISRTRPLSVKYRLPVGSTARRLGKQTLAALAGPPSPDGEQLTPPRPPDVTLWLANRTIVPSGATFS